jgi:hypothetical protein
LPQLKEVPRVCKTESAAGREMINRETPQIREIKTNGFVIQLFAYFGYFAAKNQ